MPSIYEKPADYVYVPQAKTEGGGELPSGVLYKALVAKENPGFKTRSVRFFTPPGLGSPRQTKHGFRREPKASPGISAKITYYSVSGVEGSESTNDVPRGLTMVPTVMDRKLDDHTIERTIVPGQFGWDDKWDRPKLFTQIWMLVAQEYEGKESLAVLCIPMGKYEALVYQLEEAAKTKGIDITDAHWLIDTVADPEETVVVNKRSYPVQQVRVRQAEMPQTLLTGKELTDEHGVSALSTHISSIRAHYEEFCLANGWSCDRVDVNGVEVSANWHLNKAQTVPFTTDSSTFSNDHYGDEPLPAAPVEEETISLTESASSKWKTAKKADLEDELTRKGINFRPGSTKRELLALLEF